MGEVAIKRDPELGLRYIRACARKMELGHFTLTVEDGGDGDGDFAEVTRSGTHSAHIKLYTKFWLVPARTKRLTVAHELVHLHTWHLAELVPDSHAEARTDVEERLVDTMALLIAPTLPSWRGRSWR